RRGTSSVPAASRYSRAVYGPTGSKGLIRATTSPPGEASANAQSPAPQGVHPAARRCASTSRYVVDGPTLARASGSEGTGMTGTLRGHPRPRHAISARPAPRPWRSGSAGPPAPLALGIAIVRCAPVKAPVTGSRRTTAGSSRVDGRQRPRLRPHSRSESRKVAAGHDEKHRAAPAPHYLWAVFREIRV